MSDELLGGLLARLHDRTARLVVVGQGYVGLSITIRASELGFRVVGYETDLDRVHALREGRSFVDDVSGDQVRMALESDYWATGDPLDLRAFDVAVITVRPRSRRRPDLSFIEAAARNGRTSVGGIARGSRVDDLPRDH